MMIVSCKSLRLSLIIGSAYFFDTCKTYLCFLMKDTQSNSTTTLFLQLVTMEMPFGKFKGTLLCDLPVHYLEWFQRQGFPSGKLGVLLATMYEIRLNGLEQLLQPLRSRK